MQCADTPLMIFLAEPMEDDTAPARLGAMTKYKTFTGEETNGQKHWNYDFHDDDD
ncbi:hypothetical protein EV186_1128 [Labedaea rhizosphaerae]|uniref:Uncharacterized protein n=1 Tax=Labedaea rhizosphaerae TaxID=598644 RepID=A0A4V3CXB7_LABRH|nr:hypothetical protein EV186_1128 [Labedaea rhizosphaerae]